MATFNLSRFVSRVCAAGMALLGFSCSSDNPDDIPLMYGTPTGTFEIKGKVTTDSGEDVADAVIKVTHKEIASNKFSIVSVKSNGEGAYTADGIYTPYDELKVVCEPSNKEFEADSTTVRMKYIKDESNTNSWNIGHAEATVNFTLKKKKKE